MCAFSAIRLEFRIFRPEIGTFDDFFPGQMSAKVAIWRSLFKGPNKFLKMHVLGQNELKNRSKHTRAPQSAQKCLFGGRSKNGQKSQGGPFEAKNCHFGEAAAPPCVVRLS